MVFAAPRCYLPPAALPEPFGRQTCCIALPSCLSPPPSIAAPFAGATASVRRGQHHEAPVLFAQVISSIKISLFLVKLTCNVQHAITKCQRNSETFWCKSSFSFERANVKRSLTASVHVHGENTSPLASDNDGPKSLTDEPPARQVWALSQVNFLNYVCGVKQYSEATQNTRYPTKKINLNGFIQIKRLLGHR